MGRGEIGKGAWLLWGGEWSHLGGVRAGLSEDGG